MTEAIKKISSDNFYKRAKNWSRMNKTWTILIVAIILAAAYFSYTKLSTSASTIQYTFGKVRRGDLSVVVSGSGQASTLSQVDIKPNTTGQTQTLGQIVYVKVKNGDTVKAGQVVAILDGKNALQTLNQAKSSVASAQASYNKLVNGLAASDLLSLNNSITSAQVSLDNSKQDILIKLKNAYTSVANAVYLNTDSFFSNPNTSNPLISIVGVSFNNQSIQNDVETGRYNLGSILVNWKNGIDTQTVSSDMVALLNSAISNLNLARNYFDDMTMLFGVYSDASDSTGLSLISEDKSAALTARSNMDSSISDLTSALQSYNSAVIQFQQAKDSLAVKQAPPTADDLAVSKANLDNAEASLVNAETAYASRIIIAPFDGQIGGLTAAVGQSISSADSLGKLITSNKVINVTLNEIDAAKVVAGNPVTITFDSLPGLTLTGKVNYIDPLGTVSQGVVSYSVQISMDEQNDQIKTGMTATVSIVTTNHPNTLIISTTAITSIGGRKYVQIADISSSTTQQESQDSFNQASSTRSFSTSTRRNFASSTRATSTRQFANFSASSTNAGFATTQYPVIQVEITTGISNGLNTEVLSGLSEGQLVVTKKTTVGSSSTVKTAASTATTNTRGGFGGGFGGGAVGALGGAVRGN